MFASFGIRYWCPLGLIVKPNVTASDKLDSTLSWDDTGLLKDRSNASFIGNRGQFCCPDSCIGGKCDEAITRSVDEFSSCIKRLEMKVGYAGKLEIRIEKFGVSSRSYVGDVPITRVGITFVNFDFIRVFFSLVGCRAFFLYS